MINITVEVNDKALRLGLAELQTQFGTDPSEALDVIGLTTVALSEVGFDQSKDPYGEKWAPITHRGTSSRVTKVQTRRGHVSRRVWAGGQPLVDTGILRNSITHFVSPGEVLVGPGVDYGRKHQFGLGAIKQRAFLPTPEKGLPDRWSTAILGALRRRFQQR